MNWNRLCSLTGWPRQTTPSDTTTTSSPSARYNSNKLIQPRPNSSTVLCHKFSLSPKHAKKSWERPANTAD
ncbi:hypothetical protein Pmani_021728 [Petrolisthes manimaculis]|uniref:Uncharacterized protein n=1 Tax=Petrolisthes manimaculis TaxID=1843537 RepID=A0AAE1PED6_9EUCA|nr:hypothetical protein Pmani_021728 [Petrolisthes manimaculis]